MPSIHIVPLSFRILNKRHRVANVNVSTKVVAVSDSPSANRISEQHEFYQ
jgi:hypothetical protein